MMYSPGFLSRVFVEFVGVLVMSGARLIVGVFDRG